MPLVDKALPELLAYTGTNPRPPDFETYWAAALAELAECDPKLILQRNDTILPPLSECFDLWYNGVGGVRLHAKYLRPKAPAGPHPAVLWFHGYTGASPEWNHLLPFVSQGIAVAALDCRGQGGLSEDLGGTKGTTMRGQIIRGLDDPDPRKLLFRQIFLDTALLARLVMNFPEVDGQRVGTVGASQGGGLSLACAALEPRIKRAATIFPFLCDYQRVWAMDLTKDAYEELRTYFRQFDPLHAREKEIFTKLGYIDCQYLAPRIRAEVLMFTGLMDTVCPPSTQFAAFNKITSKKNYVIFPDFGHEGMPGAWDMIFNFMIGL